MATKPTPETLEPELLSEEDQQLWTLVQQSVMPLTTSLTERQEQAMAEWQAVVDGSAVNKDKQTKPVTTYSKTDSTMVAQRQGTATPSQVPQQQSLQPSRRVLRQMNQGQLSLDATIDLHGLTASSAKTRLTAFLQRAQQAGHRRVLVITGKGKMVAGGGVLRREVPLWLGAPPLQALVTGYCEAGRKLGGSGALYVFMRKKI